MIAGIGTDLCDLRRLQAVLERRGERFARRILGEQEWAVYTERNRVPLRGLRYLGSRFAAKEAFSKAIGLGLIHPMSWQACEVLNDAAGKPQVVLHGALRDWFEARAWKAHISLTDDSDYACAFAVVEMER